GSVFMVVAPDGLAMPCHSARMLPGPPLPNLRTTPVRQAWYDSEAFNRYRGQAWMSATCSACDERHHDVGGCRCQAYLVTGDAAATDPVCPKSPERWRIDAMLEGAQGACRAGAAPQPLHFVPGAARAAGLVYRSDENSRALGAAQASPC
ncbi:MAG: SPASM domain-containing protein, partial [Proteobacteria bacterium]|nr:SPASM domain-containing protein [Pseudomonadota bacterium]